MVFRRITSAVLKVSVLGGVARSVYRFFIEHEDTIRRITKGGFAVGGGILRKGDELKFLFAATPLDSEGKDHVQKVLQSELTGSEESQIRTGSPLTPTDEQ